MNISTQEIDHVEYAINQERATGKLAARILLESGKYPKVGAIHVWANPADDDNDNESLAKINIVPNIGLLSDMAREVSAAIQFPVNTAFGHGLGIVASAMSKSFRFDYYGKEKPVNLYVVGAQPPSSGKSGVHEEFSDPVQMAFDAINQSAAQEQRKIKIRIASIKKEMKGASNANEVLAFDNDLQKLYTQNDKHCIYTYFVDDATPEGISKMMAKQKGIFNIVSAEADAINIILGNVYGDKKANHGVFLKGWDAEMISIARSSSDDINCRAIGTIAVIAQSESIKSILEAGLSGRGISERFLLIMESTLLGKRKFVDESGNAIDFKRIAAEVSSDYYKMIFNLVREDKITLKFDAGSMNIIAKYRAVLEPEMGDTGIYSNNMMRGFVGKADKQIMKIASILHAIEEWREGGTKQCLISVATVQQALHIFKEITKSYLEAADKLGFAGNNAEYDKILERILNYCEKGKLVVPFSTLRSNLKDVKPFTGTPRLSDRIKNVLMPMLEQKRICVLHEGKIYINPHLKG